MVKLEAIEPSNTAYALKQADEDTLPNKTGKKITQPHPLPEPVAIESRSKLSTDQPQLTPITSGNTYLQAGAFRNQDAAMALRSQLTDLTGRPVNVDSMDGYFKVRIGPIDDMNDAQNVSDLLVQHHFPRPQVVYF
jgi:cell division protein FtsN